MAKIYVLWNTTNKGVHKKDWKIVEQFVKGVSGAQYKGFKNMELAQQAFDLGYEGYYGISDPEVNKIEDVNPKTENIASPKVSSTANEDDSDECPF